MAAGWEQRSPAGPPAAPPRARRRRFSWLVAVAVLGGLGGLALMRHESARAPEVTTVAVVALRPSFWRVSSAPVPVRAPTPVAAQAGTPDARIAVERVATPALLVVVEDATGGPIAGAQVTVGDADLGQTGATGELRLPATTLGLPHAGEMTASAPGYASGSETFVVPGLTRIKLLPGGQLLGVVVEAPAAGSGLGDRPVAGIRVTANDVEVISDRDGRFAFRALDAGLVTLGGRGPHHAGALGKPVFVGFGKVVSGVRLEVTPAFAIRGRVLVAGQPVHESGMTVRTRSQAGWRAGSIEGHVDEEGRFEVPGVPPGRYDLKVSADATHEFLGFAAPTVTVTIVADDVTQDIELGPRSSLTVELRDRAGRALPGIEIGAKQEESGGLVRVTCVADAQGLCHFVGLKRGELELFLDESDAEPHVVAIPAPGPVRFVVEGSARVEGRIVCADGRPPRKRAITLKKRGGGARSKSSGDDGSFAFLGLDPDLYLLEVQDEEAAMLSNDPAEAKLEIVLAAAERRDVVVVLPDETGRITGHVVDAAGRPAADVLVDASLWHGQSEDHLPRWWAPGLKMTVTDAAGAFAVVGVAAPHRYIVRANHPSGDEAKLLEVAPGADVLLRLAPPVRP